MVDVTLRGRPQFSTRLTRCRGGSRRAMPASVAPHRRVAAPA
ncbi:MAG: hypothetical protein ACK52I_28020 [Pseudomonadota bacterium]